MKKLPFIIIFDIDKALIGDISQLTMECALLEILYNNCKKKDINTKCPNTDIFDMQDELNNGLLRPFAKDFITFCDKKFKNAEVFFYTNSPYEWTNGGLGKNIEKALNIKVNRPFFTKENSITKLKNKKSLANIYPIIIKSLLKKYPLMKDENNVEYILNNRTIFIDDIKDNLYAYKERQLVCPKYEYYPYYDISEKLINKYNIDPQLFNDKDVLKYMDGFDSSYDKMHIYNKNGNEHQQNKEYITLANMSNAKYWELYNLKKKDDTYFKDLITELSKKSVSDDCISKGNIIAINKKLLPSKKE
jgi:hypothetical protein